MVEEPLANKQDCGDLEYTHSGRLHKPHPGRSASGFASASSVLRTRPSAAPTFPSAATQTAPGKRPHLDASRNERRLDRVSKAGTTSQKVYKQAGTELVRVQNYKLERALGRSSRPGTEDQTAQPNRARCGIALHRDTLPLYLHDSKGQTRRAPSFHAPATIDTPCLRVYFRTAQERDKSSLK